MKTKPQNNDLGGRTPLTLSFIHGEAKVSGFGDAEYTCECEKNKTGDVK